MNREILKAVIEKAQEGLVNELRGGKYARNRGAKFERAGTTDRTLETRHGTIKFKLAKVKHLENGSILRPFLLYVGLEPWRRIVEDLDFERAETATYLTYRDSKTVIENLTNAKVSKNRIHSYAQNALIEKALNHQQCVNHAVRDVGYSLWKAGLPKEERKEMRTKLKAILNTCRNSAIKHLKDGDMERLRWRTNKTVEALKQLAKELAEEGLTTAAKFIRNSANYTVTFARLALKQVRIPYTNNLIERLMGEIAKPVKNKWMHWSPTGLENLLNILLVRYCSQESFNRLKQKYLSQDHTSIHIKVT